MLKRVDIVKTVASCIVCILLMCAATLLSYGHSGEVRTEAQKPTDEVTVASETQLALPDTHEGWTPITSGEIVNISGNYYLEQDINLLSNQFIFVSGETTICLHGHTISKDTPVDVSYEWLTSSSSVAIRVLEGGSLTIMDCDGGGYLSYGVDYDHNNSSLTIRGGHISGLYMSINRDILKYAVVEGGYFQFGVTVRDFDYIGTSALDYDPDYDPLYPNAVYKRGNSSLSVTAVSRPYDGQPLTLGKDFYATAEAGYGEPQVSWAYYADKDHRQPIELEDAVNAGTYYIDASVPEYLDVKDGVKTYYTKMNKHGSITISQIDPLINVVTDKSATLYTTSEFPVISTSQGDTPGTVTWDEGQTLEAGSREYTWTFVPDDPNYKTVGGKEVLTVENTILDHIEVTQMPSKTEYTAFEIFDKSGMTVVAYFSDGAVVDVTDAVRIEKGTDVVLTCGENGRASVTVYYRGGDMTEVSARIELTVNKIKVSAPEAATGLIYDGTEKEGVAGGGLYSLTDASAIDAGDYIAELTLNDPINYTWEDGFDGKVSWSIAKAPYVGYTVPTGIEAIYGQTLADVTLPEGWQWKDGSASVGSDGKVTYTAIYVPSDKNYQAVEAEITISVAPKGLSGGAVAGIAVGSAAGAGAIGALVWFVIRRKKRSA